jgi:group I intron endonuclease
MIGIYKITSPTNRIYIGQSWNIKERVRSYEKINCKDQTNLYNSLNKYGWEAHKFEVVHELPADVTQKVMNAYEIFYWQQHKDCKFKMLNIREPGSNGKLSKETKIKIGKKSKGNTYVLGKRWKLTEEQKNNKKGEKNPMYGKNHSEKTKKIFSSQRQDKLNSQYGKPSICRKKIKNIENNQIYESITEAALHFNITRKTIRDWIKKEYKLKYINK